MATDQEMNEPQRQHYLDVVTFDQVEECLRTAKTENEAKAAREAIQRAFTERDEMRARIEMLEATNQQLRDDAEKQKIGFFNLNDHATRAAIMAQLALTAPKVQHAPQPELSAICENGAITKQSIALCGREMTIDEAEATVFRLYEVVARARLHEGTGNGG